jgi:hypothetical protein
MSDTWGPPIKENRAIMKEATKRSIFRWTHIVFSIPIPGYIYSPFERLPDYAPATRVVFLPAMVVTDCGCEKAMSFDGLFRKYRPNKALRISPSPLVALAEVTG